MTRRLFQMFLLVWFHLSSLGAYEFSIATMFQDEAPYLKEWIEYHLMVGAEHFWLYNNLSSDNWEEVLAPYIEKGLVEVISWPLEPSDLKVSVNKFPFQLQADAVKDALQKAKGNTKWLSFIDTDEFFLPKQHKTVPECLDAYFSEASAVFISWRNFGTNRMYIPKGEPFLCRLTACSSKDHSKNKNGKSIWRPEKIDIDSVWWVHWAQLNAEGKYVNGYGEDMILDGPQAQWVWKMCDGPLVLHHYFFRDEDFFHSKRLRLAERGFSEYSTNGLWSLYSGFLKQQNTSMKDFIQNHHRESYERYWKKYK